MGLARPALQFLAKEHKKNPFKGSILILGRQCVYATEEDALSLLKQEKINPVVLKESFNKKTNIPSFKGSPEEKFISDVYFFNLLGLSDIQAMDYSSYEGAEIVHDLNQPVPDHLKNRFDLILDGGTLEHVFDVRQSLANIGSMLKVGGRVIHMSPANNYVQHGFYQFSPTLFFDYYRTNEFKDLKGFIFEHDQYSSPHCSWEMYELTGKEYGQITSSKLLATLFVAEKSKESAVNKIPTQGFYTQVYAQGLPTSQPSRLKEIAKQIVPQKIKHFIRRVRRSNLRKPWGLKKWDVLG